MRLIADGVVDRDGVAGLSRRLGYSVRHLNRLVTDELGAGPLALARAQRAQTARILIETTSLSMTDIAFAAGFGSIRQFNDTIRDVFASTPSDLRSPTGRRAADPGVGSVAVRLATRQPFAGDELVAFVGAHAVPGIEHWDGETLRRSLSLPFGHGVVALTPAVDHVDAIFRLVDWRDLAPAVERVRRWLDLDADPEAIDDDLHNDPVLAPLVDATPGMRSPGSIDPYETAIRTIVGQQVSVAGARTVTGRIVAAHGMPLQIEDAWLDRVFPSAVQLAGADPALLPLPARRGETVRRVAAAAASGEIDLGIAADRSVLVRQLAQLKGVGPWTIQHIEMRGYGDPDVFLDGDLVAKRALAALDLESHHTDRWRPWRSYALRRLWHHVWRPT